MTSNGKPEPLSVLTITLHHDLRVEIGGTMLTTEVGLNMLASAARALEDKRRLEVMKQMMAEQAVDRANMHLRDQLAGRA